VQRKLSIFDMLRILLTGTSYIGNYKNKGWKDSLPFYAFKCPKHGIITNHVKEYNKRLECPKCKTE
jgi:hypothetical protein